MNPGRSTQRGLLWCVVALIATACSTPPAEQSTVPPTAPPAVQRPIIPNDVKSVSDLVGLYGQVAAMQPEDRRRVYVDATQTFSRNPNSYNRIRVALLASMPGTTFQDDKRAMSLLEPYARSGRSSAGPSSNKLHQFGAMLHTQLEDRVKALARTEQLQKQLDALRAVERTIIERGQPEPPAKK